MSSGTTIQVKRDELEFILDGLEKGDENVTQWRMDALQCSLFFKNGYREVLTNDTMGRFIHIVSVALEDNMDVYGTTSLLSILCKLVIDKLGFHHIMDNQIIPLLIRRISLEEYYSGVSSGGEKPKTPSPSKKQMVSSRARKPRSSAGILPKQPEFADHTATGAAAAELETNILQDVLDTLSQIMEGKIVSPEFDRRDMNLNDMLVFCLCLVCQGACESPTASSSSSGQADYDRTKLLGRKAQELIHSEKGCTKLALMAKAEICVVENLFADVDHMSLSDREELVTKEMNVSLSRLTNILHLIENCTFEFPNNQTSIARWMDPSSPQRKSLVFYLFRACSLLKTHLDSQKQRRQSLYLSTRYLSQLCFVNALRALMNITNRCADGCDAVRVLGKQPLHLLIELLSNICPALFESFLDDDDDDDNGDDDTKNRNEDDENDANVPNTNHTLPSKELSWKFDVVLMTLGILINLVEEHSGNRVALSQCVVAQNADWKLREAPFLKFVVVVFEQTLPKRVKAGFHDPNATARHRKRELDVEFGWSAEQLVVSAYTSLLLGCMIRENRENRDAVLSFASWQPSFSPFIQVLQAFVGFQNDAGVLTQDANVMIRRVMEEMKIADELVRASLSSALSSSSSTVTARGSMAPPPNRFRTSTDQQRPSQQEEEQQQQQQQSVAYRAFQIGDLVRVAKRTTAGFNLLGGVGKIHGFSTSTGNSYDVKYVLGGSEKNVHEMYITKVEETDDARARTRVAASHDSDTQNVANKRIKRPTTTATTSTLLTKPILSVDDEFNF